MPISDLYGSLDVAIYETVNGFVDPVTKQRGATALAPRVGMQPNTLSNKANPNCDHKLALRESIPVQLLSDNFSILHAYAAQLGHCAVQLPPASDVGDAALLDDYCRLHAELGTFAEDLRDALEAGQVTPAAVQRMRAKFDDAIRAGLGVLARMEALVRV